jgi:hypothetical protein
MGSSEKTFPNPPDYIEWGSPVSSIYIWSENSSPKSEASFVLTAQTKTIERDWDWRPNSSFNFRHLGKECAEISYFYIDLKNNTMVLWTDNLIVIRSVRKKRI